MASTSLASSPVFVLGQDKPLPIKQPGIDDRGLNGYFLERFTNKHFILTL